ncbi:MAG TPA: AraC family transcriptional regulator, partial [Thermoanaerobaculia bacterium]
TDSWFGITCWDCSGGQKGISDERQQYWHVISFLHDGAFVLHSQGRSEVVDPTSVLLYNPRAPYQSSHPFGCCDHGSALVIRRDSLLDVMLHHDPTAEERPDALFTRPLGRGLSRAYMLQRMMVGALQRQAPADPLALEAIMFRILREVAGSIGESSRFTVRRDAARSRRHYVADTKALLQQRFREKLRLDDIGRALHVSTYHLCRLFKEETGEPIHRYLNRLRLRHAMESLAAGPVDLSDLAVSLGFSDHSHFTVAFRKEFGISPGQVRRLGNDGHLSDLMKM